MRTTVNLDEDVAAAVQKRQREEGLGLSETVNKFIREALIKPRKRKPYVHRSSNMGPPKIDITNIGEVLDYLDQFGE